LSALASLLASCGHAVSGSDRNPPGEALVESLLAAGVSLEPGHAAEHIEGVELLIRSAAVPDSNPEVEAAQRAGVPVLKYSEALGRLMSTRRGLAVAGTHGKTSTTAMAAHLLRAAGADPAWIVGGQPLGMPPFGWGSDGPMIVEACEYDCSFLNLSYDVALVTGVAVDHLDCFGDFDGVLAAFRRFCAGVSAGGQLVLGPGVAELLEPQLPSGATLIQVDEVLPLRSAHPEAGGWRASLGRAGDAVEHSVWLPLLGRHDLDNMRCALVAAHCSGVPMDELLPHVASFAGVGRRLQALGTAPLPGAGRVTVVDDFAHHPDALAAALAAARSHFADRRVVAVFQPHQVSRTEDLFDGFTRALRGFDVVALCDIFVTRDAHPERAQELCSRLARESGPHVVRVGPAAAAMDRLHALLRPDDLCLVMGAGDVDGLAERLVGAAARP
jgi:UDP-N-acetylmuramate--alanine ligase